MQKQKKHDNGQVELEETNYSNEARLKEIRNQSIML